MSQQQEKTIKLLGKNYKWLKLNPNQKNSHYFLDLNPDGKHIYHNDDVRDMMYIAVDGEIWIEKCYSAHLYEILNIFQAKKIIKKRLGLINFK